MELVIRGQGCASTWHALNDGRTEGNRRKRILPGERRILIVVDRAVVSEIGLQIFGRVLQRRGKLVSVRFLGRDGLRHTA